MGNKSRGAGVGGGVGRRAVVVSQFRISIEILGARLSPSLEIRGTKGARPLHVDPLPFCFPVSYGVYGLR